MRVNDRFVADQISDLEKKNARLSKQLQEVVAAWDTAKDGRKNKSGSSVCISE